VTNQFVKAGDAPRLVTLLTVAEMLQLSPHTIRSFVRKGRLRPVRICRRLLFDPGELQRFLEEAR
jgi:predicted site-specific integrase-resolvase